MKLSPVRFAFAALASLAMMGTSADAAIIFVYSQQNVSDVVTVQSSGGSTILTTGIDGPPAEPINVVVSNLGGITPPSNPQTGAPFTLAETFDFRSSGPITTTAAGTTQTGFAGSFSFGNQVIGNVTNGVLTASGSGANASASFRSDNVTFTALGAAILAQLGISGITPGLTGAISIALTPNIGGNVTGLNFTAVNSGNISANVVPEPASVVMTSMALVAGLGCFGLRRAKASRA